MLTVLAFSVGLKFLTFMVFCLRLENRFGTIGKRIGIAKVSSISLIKR